MESLKPSSIKEGVCEGANRQITITPEGYVLTCQGIQKSFAQVSELVSLKEIWTNEEFIDKRKKMIKDHCNGCWFACTRDSNV